MPLSEAQVVEAIAQWLAGRSQREIARAMGQDNSTLSARIRIFVMRYGDPRRGDPKQRARLAMEKYHERISGAPVDCSHAKG